MQWLKFWSSSTNTKEEHNTSTSSLPKEAERLISRASDTTNSLREHLQHTAPTTSSAQSSDFLTSLTSPPTLLAATVLTTAILALTAFSRRYLSRIPTAPAIPPTHIFPSTRHFTRSLFGHVTSIGDADNFRLYHTPLGRIALWGLARSVPTTAKALKDNTIHIRLAGVDAPELAHFGRPAQPFSKDALQWLTAYLQDRRVRCYVHKIDQYGRAVATVYIRRGLLRRDVGLQMLRAGLATVYEAKSGAVFGGVGVEQAYRDVEEQAKKKGRGMWAAQKGGFFGGGAKLETPREYKNKYRNTGVGTAAEEKG